LPHKASPFCVCRGKSPSAQDCTYRDSGLEDFAARGRTNMGARNRPAGGIAGLGGNQKPGAPPQSPRAPSSPESSATLWFPRPACPSRPRVIVRTWLDTTEGPSQEFPCLWNCAAKVTEQRMIVPHHR
jgi:hypothetical protein